MYKDMPTILVCNPNAMYYQHMVNHPHAFYLRFFLNRNINVMLWNYRGYGLSNGTPDPYNVKTDSEVILQFMKDTMKLKGKFGAYGRSLGGLATTHLADKLNLIIADRTFYDFDILADRKFYSLYSKHLFRLGTCKWRSINHSNIIHKGTDSCYKVIMIEKNDEIVEVHSSLMTGVAKELYRRSKHKINITPQFINSLQFVVNLEHDLYTILDYQQKEENLASESDLDQT